MDMQGFLVELGDKTMPPRFMVGREELERVQPLLGVLSLRDANGVVDRLEALEPSYRQGMDR